MQVVKVFFTVLLIAFVCWLVADTVRLIIRKVKEKNKKKMQSEEVKKDVIEQKDDNSN